MGIAYNNTTIVTSGLVLYVDPANTKSYPGSGTNFFDLTTEDNDGILTGGLAYASNNNGVMVFDGLDDFVEFGTIPLGHELQLLGDYTITSWIYPDLTGDSFPRIIDKSDAGSWTNGWGSCVNVSTGNEFLFQTNNNVGSLVLSLAAVTSQAWAEYTVTYTGSTLSVYKNGVLDNTAAGVSNVDVATGMRIGSWNHSTGREWKGEIGPNIIYNVALTADEITQNFEALRGRYGI